MKKAKGSSPDRFPSIRRSHLPGHTLQFSAKRQLFRQVPIDTTLAPTRPYPPILSQKVAIQTGSHRYDARTYPAIPSSSQPKGHPPCLNPADTLSLPDPSIASSRRYVPSPLNRRPCLRSGGSGTLWDKINVAMDWDRLGKQPLGDRLLSRVSI